MKSPPTNPVLDAVPRNLMVELEERRAALRRAGKRLFDFGLGDPREPTPPFLREALRAAAPEVSQYPSPAGTPALVLVGELTISIVFRINKARLGKLNARVEKMNRLSEEALNLGDAQAYRAINKEGNDAFGHLFFNKFGLSAASLWPIFFALAWRQERFAEIGLPLPWIGWEINYSFFFLLCYILARIFFGRVKRSSPLFQRHASDAEGL